MNFGKEVLPALEVVQHEGAWRCLSNRRLWRFEVKVKILSHIPDNFHDKNTSVNDGLSVQIDGHEESLREHFKLSVGGMHSKNIQTYQPMCSEYVY